MEIRRYFDSLNKSSIGLMKKGLKLLTNKDILLTNGESPSELNETQRMFLEWNACRLGISFRESKGRYCKSYEAIYGGHNGPGYRLFNDISYKTYQVFFSDSEGELIDAYVFHAPMHFLRMLSYLEPIWNDNHIIVQKFRSHAKVDILDYGCGLAQRSRSLAIYLKQKGKDVKLCLADIPSIRKQFLMWVCKKESIETSFLDCTTEIPHPDIPPCDICFANEFFEHVRNPLQYLDAFHEALKPNGIIESNISDHRKEFMHVFPLLNDVRDRIRMLGYKELTQNNLYQKE